jgi:hypothetical protein
LTFITMEHVQTLKYTRPGATNAQGTQGHMPCQYAYSGGMHEGGVHLHLPRRISPSHLAVGTSGAPSGSGIMDRGLNPQH